jgi:hypothetical protein
LDNDPVALDFINSRATASGLGLLSTCRVDLQKDWPYSSDTVGAIISVHCPFPGLVHRFVSSLTTGGYLLLETIGGQGGNYLALPEPGFFRSALMNAFELKYFEEKQVGTAEVKAATTKLVAVKREAPCSRCR